jgi:phage shock protein E
MKYLVIDVREPEEYANGHVKGALNIPPGELMNGSKKLKDIPKDSNTILYCLSGSRSNVSKCLMQDIGFINITNGINQQQVEAKFGL